MVANVQDGPKRSDLRQPMSREMSGESPKGFVSSLREGVSKNVKNAYSKSKGRLFHVIASKDRILQFRIIENNKLVLENTINALNMHTRTLRNAPKRLLVAGRQVPIKAQKKVRGVITGDPNKRIRDHLKEPPQVRFLDKFSFTLGVLVITFTEFIILRHPAWFQTFYQCLMPILFALRFVKFQSLKYQWFMLDFCYLVNASCMLQTFYYPNNSQWFVMNFAASVGPLAASIVVWKNSLVFHCLDKLTTFFLHAFPALLCHLIRWDLIPSDAQLSLESVRFWPFYCSAMGLYLGWQISYLFVTEWMFRNRLNADPDLCTSLRYLAADKKNPVTQAVEKFSRRVGVLQPHESLNASDFRTKIVFVLTQLMYTLITLIPPYLIFKSYIACLTYLITLFVWSTWNGASYYIEVFSKRYQMKFQEDGLRRVSMDSNLESESTVELDDGEDEFLDSVEDLPLNESQAMELIEILQNLEGKTDPSPTCSD